MSYFMNLLVLQKYYGNGRHRRRRSKPKKKTAFEEAIESNNYSRNRDMDFVTALRLAIGFENNPVLISFFEDLYQYGKKVDNIDAEEYIKQNNRLKRNLENKVNKLDNLVKKVKVHGISLGGYKKGFTIYLNPKKSDAVKLISWGESIKLDGVVIKLGDLETLKLSNAEHELEHNIELVKYEDALLKKLDKLKNTRDYRDEKKQEEKNKQIFLIEYKLKEIEKAKTEIIRLKGAIEKFSKLSADDIKNIKNVLLYLEELKEFVTNKEFIEIYRTMFDTISAIYHYDPHRKHNLYGSSFPVDNTTRKRCERAIELMERDGKFSEERVVSLALEFKKIREKLETKYYQEEVWVYSQYAYLQRSKMISTDIDDFLILMDSYEKSNSKFDDLVDIESDNIKKFKK